jgi:hypothetical protein
MPVRIQTLPAPRAGVAALRLDGAVARGDHRRFAAAAAACLDAGATGLVLELTDLSSISEELADEIALLLTRLPGDGARVAVVGASVVVGWFLRRRLGELQLREGTTVEAAAAAVAGDAAAAGARPSPPLAAAAAMRARSSFAAASGFLEVLAGCAATADWIAALADLVRRHGMAREVHLLRCEGGRLFLDGHLDALSAADSPLAMQLAAVDAPLAMHELGAGDLPLREQNFLRWTGADIVVPLKAEGELKGALFVRSGHDGGLFACRPGEILGWTLLGCLIGERLAQLSPAPSFAADADCVEALLAGV